MAALEHVTGQRGEEMRRELAERRAKMDTRAVVDLVFDLFSGTFFRAALMLWVAAAAEPQLRDQVVPWRPASAARSTASWSNCWARTSSCPASARPCKPPSTSHAGSGWRIC